MNDKISILISQIERDLTAIESIYDELEGYSLNQQTEKETLIVVAYHLHNIYNAFENMFLNVARTFENSIADQGQWHAQLLERMTLNINGMRPALIDEQARDCLDELRRFRHVFRHAYLIKLDSMRLQLVKYKADQLRPLYPAQIERFVDFLQ